VKDLDKINKQINDVIFALEDTHLRLKGKGKLIGKLRSSRDLVKKLIIPDVVVPKGTLPNNCKVCGRTQEDMAKMTSMCSVSACPNY